MNILHVGLVGPSNEEMSYQGAILPKENKAAGHDVTVIRSCYKWSQDRVVKVPEEDTIIDGIRYIRLSYDKIISEMVTEKIRKSKKLKSYLKEIKPDVILNHDVETFELLTVARYKKNNPNIKLYVDNHSDSNNSATNWISMNFLHKMFYGMIIRQSITYIDKILCISYEAIDFLKKVHKIQDNILEFYPLGGTIISMEEKMKYRNEKRSELSFSEKDIIFCHSGKMDYKKRTFELILNFVKVKNPNFKLIIVGVFTEDVEKKVIPLINDDDRIINLGWKNANELIEYIAASDLYVQPGSQSATMQNSLCVGTPVLFDNVKSHEAFMHGNAFAINNYDDMEIIFNQISENPDILSKMSVKAYDLAKDLLDYRKLAERITF